MKSAFDVLNRVYRRLFANTVSWCYLDDKEKSNLGIEYRKQWREFLRSQTQVVVHVENPGVMLFSKGGCQPLPYSVIDKLKKSMFSPEYQYFTYADCPFEDLRVVRGFKTLDEAKEALRRQRKNGFVFESFWVKI